ncbi:hypothetical protein GLYMA_05G152050v4 [Glycine max]|nr:hypothetical protein GLYMA_05G152050v4 [Glycine max]KAH1134547.1 hypothetical protein GYH30_012744 [Glycine max]
MILFLLAFSLLMFLFSLSPLHLFSSFHHPFPCSQCTNLVSGLPRPLPHPRSNVTKLDDAVFCSETDRLYSDTKSSPPLQPLSSTTILLLHRHQQSHHHHPQNHNNPNHNPTQTHSQVSS